MLNVSYVDEVKTSIRTHACIIINAFTVCAISCEEIFKLVCLSTQRTCWCFMPGILLTRCCRGWQISNTPRIRPRSVTWSQSSKKSNLAGFWGDLGEVFLDNFLTLVPEDGRGRERRSAGIRLAVLPVSRPGHGRNLWLYDCLLLTWWLSWQTKYTVASDPDITATRML